jgi:hypothetical protein
VKFQHRHPKLAAVLAAVCLLPGFALMAQATPAHIVQDGISEAEQNAFAKGQTLYNQGLYGEAIAVFSDALKLYPNSAIKDLTLLWLGRSYLKKDDLANAESIDQRLREMPETPLVELYEEELRIARLDYAKSPSARVAETPALTATASSSVPPKQTATSSSTKPLGATSSAPVADAPAVKKKENPAPASLSVTKAVPKAAPKVAPKVVAAEPLEVKREVKQLERKEPQGLRPPVPDANVMAPLVHVKVEETPVSANGIVTYRLVLLNDGCEAARELTARIEFDGVLTFVSSDPEPVRQEIVAGLQRLTFRLPSLESGESRVIRIELRRRRPAATESAKRLTQTIIYRDAKGNNFSTQ